MHEAWQEAQTTAADVNQKHARSQQELQAEVQRRAWEIHNDYLRSLLEASGSEEAQERTARVQSDFAVRQQELEAETQRRAWELHQQHLRSLSETQGLGSTRDRFEQIYRDYVQELQRAWAQVDVSELDPASLAAISQSLAAVASAASNTTGNR
jgi:preprotein translocase subunit SecF